MAGKGIMVAIMGKPKGKPMAADDGAEMEDSAEGEGGDVCSQLAGEAFDAIKDGDREGFIAAMSKMRDA